MSLKTAVEKVFAPVVAEYGFTQNREFDLGDGEVRFYNADGSLHIDISKETFRPLKQHTLSVIYFIPRIDHPGSDALSASSFAPGFGLDVGPFYMNQAEHESKLKQIAEGTVKNVLPYLKRRAQFYVRPTYEMYKLLSDGPIEQAEAFAERHGLSMQEEKENWVKLEAILLELRGGDELLRKEMFFQNLEEVMAAAAYMGEIKRRFDRHPSQWKWIEQTGGANGEEIKSVYFGLDYYGEGTSGVIDFLFGFWNNYPEIPCARISPDLLYE